MIILLGTHIFIMAILSVVIKKSEEISVTLDMLKETISKSTDEKLKENVRIDLDRLYNIF